MTVEERFRINSVERGHKISKHLGGEKRVLGILKRRRVTAKRRDFEIVMGLWEKR